MKLLKKGDKGPDVVTLQQKLKIAADGIFGPQTEKTVIRFQLHRGLKPDGIVGNKTWGELIMSTNVSIVEAIDEDTDVNGQYFTTPYNQTIHRHYLGTSEYLAKPLPIEYCFLHHTAGRENPYKVVDHWDRDSRGRVATEFVVGGQSHRTGDDEYDGVVVQAFPETGYGWHLGKTGSGKMNRSSLGIEICSAGWLEEWMGGDVANPDTQYRTYFNSIVAKDQVIKLDQPFRGKQYYHKYSDAQIEAVKLLLEYIAERDNIDMRLGLQQWIKKMGPAKAFGFQEDAYYGKVRGLLSHTNVRRDKSDVYPDERLVEVILNL
jgi:N-acetyl-anhydromuramyl-L-alanine amidase AmpD|tara:strand:- start:10540 stop:11496 length:957 start_codon:yes stop_codon:yes gene_type:complete